MAVPRIEDTIEGRLVRLEQVLTVVVEQQAAILDKLDEPAVFWMGTEQAALYVGTTPKALRAAEYRGKVKGHRAGNGRVLYHKTDLDKFAQANDGR
jgi:hypothetical protein